MWLSTFRLFSISIAGGWGAQGGEEKCKHSPKVKVTAFYVTLLGAGGPISSVFGLRSGPMLWYLWGGSSLLYASLQYWHQLGTCSQTLIMTASPAQRVSTSYTQASSTNQIVKKWLRSIPMGNLNKSEGTALSHVQSSKDVVMGRISNISS